MKCLLMKSLKYEILAYTEGYLVTQVPPPKTPQEVTPAKILFSLYWHVKGPPLSPCEYKYQVVFSKITGS